MTNDGIVSFVQRRFGTNNGIPPNATARPPCPDWIAGDIRERSVPIESDSIISIEDHVPGPNDPQPAINGCSTSTINFAEKNNCR
jgi:hypothetical protein